MTVGSAARRPMILAVGLADGKVVDAGESHPHQAVVVEFPVLVAVGAEPVLRVVVTLVGEAYGNAIRLESPHLLDEPVVQLPGPFSREEGDDLVAAVDEFGAVPPAGID